MLKNFLSTVNENLSKDTFSRVFYDGTFYKKKGVPAFSKMLKKLDLRFTLENMPKLAKVRLPVHLVWAMKDSFQTCSGLVKILNEAFQNIELIKIENYGLFLQLGAINGYLQAQLKA